MSMLNPMLSLNVQPQEVKKYIEKVEIIKMNVDLYNGASLDVVLRSSDGEYISNHTLQMSKDEYNTWLDDDYIKSWVLSKLNLVLSNI